MRVYHFCVVVSSVDVDQRAFLDLFASGEAVAFVLIEAYY